MIVHIHTCLCVALVAPLDAVYADNSLYIHPFISVSFLHIDRKMSKHLIHTVCTCLCVASVMPPSPSTLHSARYTATPYLSIYPYI